jgi:hypothetical protein
MAYPLDVQTAPILQPPARDANAIVPFEGAAAAGSDNYVSGYATGRNVIYDFASGFTWFTTWAEFRGETAGFRYPARG